VRPAPQSHPTWLLRGPPCVDRRPEQDRWPYAKVSRGSTGCRGWGPRRISSCAVALAGVQTRPLRLLSVKRLVPGGQDPGGPAAAIVEFMLSALVENPHRVGGRLQRELSGLYSARRGAYRVAYEIDEEQWAVVVLRVHPQVSHLSIPLTILGDSKLADSGPLVATAGYHSGYRLILGPGISALLVGMGRFELPTPCSQIVSRGARECWEPLGRRWGGAGERPIALSSAVPRGYQQAEAGGVAPLAGAGSGGGLCWGTG
jgi:hypothetical protein